MVRETKPHLARLALSPRARFEISRRRALLIGAGALGAAAASSFPAPAILAASKRLKIGFVSPKTGPLAPFGEADGFVIGGIKKALGGGLKIGTRSYEVEIIDGNSTFETFAVNERDVDFIVAALNAADRQEQLCDI